MTKYFQVKTLDSTERATFRPLHGQPRVPFCFLFTLQELLQLQRKLHIMFKIFNN